MKREFRLRKGSEFDTAYSEGTVIGGPLVVLRVLPNLLGHPRWGFAVGKKIAPKATVRNRVKRLMKEAARVSAFPGSADIIVTARREALSASCAELRHALERGLARVSATVRDPE
jgi:ribonuclease P protein component